MRNVWMLWSNVWMHWSKPDTRTRGTCVPEGRSASGRLFLLNERRETTRIEATTCTVASPRPVLTVTPTFLKECPRCTREEKGCDPRSCPRPGVARSQEKGPAPCAEGCARREKGCAPPFLFDAHACLS